MWGIGITDGRDVRYRDPRLPCSLRYASAAVFSLLSLSGSVQGLTARRSRCRRYPVFAVRSKRRGQKDWLVCFVLLTDYRLELRLIDLYLSATYVVVDIAHAQLAQSLDQLVDGSSVVITVSQKKVI